MKPVTYHLTERQIERLKAESSHTGLAVAELIRRALDVAIMTAFETGKLSQGVQQAYLKCPAKLAQKVSKP